MYSLLCGGANVTQAQYAAYENIGTMSSEIIKLFVVFHKLLISFLYDLGYY